MEASTMTSSTPITQAAPAQVASPVFVPEPLACRILDIVGSLALLVVLSPLMLAILIAVRLDSPGNPIFRQRRMGHGVRPFTITKFRTMRTGSDHSEHRSFVHGFISGNAEPQPHSEGSLFKLTTDPRVTRIGAFLRRTSLDELPQLWDVLCGSMSLVGPRPCLEYELEYYPQAALERFAVKPGITGLWQVSGRSELTFEEMIALDIDYARQISAMLNVRILLRTIPVVLLGKGAA
jgi:lipopolysaccharide/colanic/teichoic acid biosynthesis glycosyltransferase